MNRSAYMLISGIYTTILAVSMVFMPEMTLTNYGVSHFDLSHIALMQLLGICNGTFALQALLNRNAPNSYSLRTLLLSFSALLLAAVLLGIYHVYALHVPISSFFIGDTLFRLALGLGYMYFYNYEAKQATVA